MGLPSRLITERVEKAAAVSRGVPDLLATAAKIMNATNGLSMVVEYAYTFC